MADEAAAAVRVLLTSRDPAALSAANATLAQVAADPHAGWPVAFALASAPDDHAAFFGLNLLLAKTRSQRLADADAKALYDWLHSRLDVRVNPPPLLRDRMCTLLAALAAASGGKAVTELVEEALAMRDESTALSALTALAEEALHRGRALGFDVTDALQEAADGVVAFASHAASRGNAVAAFQCLANWCRAGVTLSQLAHEDAAVASPLLSALISAAGALDGDERAADAAAAVLEDLLEAVDPLPGRVEAVARVAQGMGAAWGALAAAAEGGDGSAFGTTRGRAALRVAAALAGPEASWLAAALKREEPEATACLRCLLTAAAAAPPDGAAFAALAPWPKLACVPPSSWPPGARDDLFAALLAALLQRAAGAAAGRAANAMDEEAEESLLEGPGAAAMAAAAAALGITALEAALIPRAASGDAAAAEAAFWAAAAVGDAHNKFPDAELARLASALTTAAADAAPALPPRCVAAAAEAMRALANPLASCGADTLCSAAAVALRVLSTAAQTEAAERGVAALEAICAAAAQKVDSARELLLLAPACETATSAVPVQDAAARVTGALTAMAAVLPVADAAKAMVALMQPALARLRAALELRNATAAGDALAALAAWADRGGAGVLTCSGAPAEAATALQAAWEAADCAAAAAGADPRVAAAASSLWLSLATAQSFSDNSAVPRAAHSAAALWGAHATPQAAQCLESLLSLYIPPSEPCAALTDAVRSLARTAPALAASGAHADEASAALFSLCGAARLDRPAMLAGEPMAALLSAALELAPAREETHARAALRFLAAVLTADMEQPPDAQAAALAPQALRVCVAAAAETSPPPLLPDVADCIRAALSAMPHETGLDELGVALIGRHAGASAALMRGAGQTPPHSNTRFQAMVAAFSGICRGELALDAMDAY